MNHLSSLLADHFFVFALVSGVQILRRGSIGQFRWTKDEWNEQSINVR